MPRARLLWHGQPERRQRSDRYEANHAVLGQGMVDEANERSSRHRMGVAVASVMVGPYGDKDWAKLAERNHRLYCARHGYHYALLTRPRTNRHPTWEKIALARDLLADGFEIVFWMDADSVFASFAPRVEDLIPGDKEFAFAGDTLLINAGHWIIRNTPWSRGALDEIYRINQVDRAGLLSSTDNAAFAVWLAGGTPDSTAEEKTMLYHRVNVGFRDRGWRDRIERGEAGNLIAAKHRGHVALLPKIRVNSYARDFRQGHFIFHAVAETDTARLSLLQALVDDSGEPRAGLRARMGAGWVFHRYCASRHLRRYRASLLRRLTRHES